MHSERDRMGRRERVLRLIGETCELRPFEPGDAPSLAGHANDRDVWLNLIDQRLYAAYDDTLPHEDSQ